MKTLIVISVLLVCHLTNGQNRIGTGNNSKTSSDSIYVPVDLDDCFKSLDTIFPDSIKALIRGLTENDFSGRYHFGLGMWMRNNWGLWQGSRLSKYFKSLGIYHPDDMTGIIFNSYHRRMLESEIRLNEQIKFYQDYWEKSKQDDLERRINQFNLYKMGDSVSFKYHYGFTTKKQEKKFDNDICAARGIVAKKDTVNFLIKVRLVESCGKKGIVSQDNKGAVIIDTKTGKSTKPKKRIIVYMKLGQEFWFNYDDWDTLD